MESLAQRPPAGGGGGTVGEALSTASETLRTSGSETPRLDAELLLGHVVHADRSALLAHPEAPLSVDQRTAFESGVRRRAAGEPVAYIRGTKEFYGLALFADRRALIPRPETELLVELGLERLRRLLVDVPRPAGAPPIRVWDVGTGSGAVCVAMAVEARRLGYGAEVRFLATDASPEALGLAVENAVGHGVADAIEFAHADLTTGAGFAPADVLVANLPYIPSSVVPELPVAASFEPRAALDGGADGLDVIRRLLEQLPEALVERGVALLEIGDDQADAAAEAAALRLAGWQTTVHRDLAGRPRVMGLARTADVTHIDGSGARSAPGTGA